MKNFWERRRQQAHDKQVLELSQQDIDAGYEREFDLGISPSELTAFLGVNVLGSPEELLPRDSLRLTLDKLPKRTTTAQRKLIDQASREAARTMEVDDPLAFFNGYHLYLAVLKHKKVQKRRLALVPDIFAQIIPDLSTSSGVIGLERQAYEVAPVLPGVAQDVFTVAKTSDAGLLKQAKADRYRPVHDRTLIAAGVGMACLHAQYAKAQQAIIDNFEPTRQLEE